MRYYCTLFNQVYLSRGIALIESLRRKTSSFHLYVYAFDDKTEEILKSINYQDVTVISLSEFENPELLAVKPSRSLGEYCWTCTPAVIKHSIETFDLESCTYLDADLYFYEDPEILFKEIEKANKDVLITPHNYTWLFDQSHTSGIYCIQFMYFKNNEKGMEVLNHWYQQCLEWCFARVEEGRFGDQKYLDVWPNKFSQVHELVHLGAVAPWNIQQFKFKLANGVKMIKALSGRLDEIVFFHFHGHITTSKEGFFRGWYPIKKNIIVNLFQPYEREIIQIDERLKNEFDFVRPYSKVEFNLQSLKRFIKKMIASVLVFFRYG